MVYVCIYIYINIRILATTISGIVSPTYWPLQTECEMLLFMWSFGPLVLSLVVGLIGSGAPCLDHWGLFGGCGAYWGCLGLGALLLSTP